MKNNYLNFEFVERVNQEEVNVVNIHKLATNELKQRSAYIIVVQKHRQVATFQRRHRRQDDVVLKLLKLSTQEMDVNRVHGGALSEKRRRSDPRMFPADIEDPRRTRVVNYSVWFRFHRGDKLRGFERRFLPTLQSTREMSLLTGGLPRNRRRGGRKRAEERWLLRRWHGG